MADAEKIGKDEAPSASEERGSEDDAPRADSADDPLEETAGMTDESDPQATGLDDTTGAAGPNETAGGATSSSAPAESGEPPPAKKKVGFGGLFKKKGGSKDAADSKGGAATPPEGGKKSKLGGLFGKKKSSKVTPGPPALGDAEEGSVNESDLDSDWGKSDDDVDRDRTQLASHPYPRLPWLRRRDYISAERTAEDVIVTKGELIGFLNVYLWFVDAGKGIPFTVAMWLVFMTLVLVHGSVLDTYRVKQGVATTIEGIVAHPLLGDTPEVAMTQDTVVPVHCDCNCIPRDMAQKVGAGEWSVVVVAMYTQYQCSGDSRSMTRFVNTCTFCRQVYLSR